MAHQIDRQKRNRIHRSIYCKEIIRNVTEDVILYMLEGPLYKNSQENVLSGFHKKYQ